MRRIDDWTEPVPDEDERPTSEAEAVALPSGVRSRIVARVIDPSVREDGLGEPVMLFPSRRSEPGAGMTAARANGSGGGSHPVRDRLLAKARAAAASASDAGPGSAEAAPLPERARPKLAPEGREADDSIDVTESDFVDDVEEPVTRFDAVPELADDLDLIGAPERPRTPPATRAVPPLAAPAALLLGTLFGVAGLAVLFAVLIQASPREPLLGRAAPERAQAALVPAPSAPAVSSSMSKRAPRKQLPGPWRVADAENDASLVSVKGSVGNNSFLGAAQAAGIERREAYRVLKAFEGLKDLNRCRPRDVFHALLHEGTGRISAFEYSVNAEEVYQAREGPDGLLAAQQLDLQVRRERAQGVIVVEGTFDAAAEKAGFEPGLGAIVNKALAGYSSVGEMKDGDVVAIVVQEVTTLGNFSRYAGVEALEYRPIGNEPVRLYYHATEKARGYVDSKGRVFGKSRWARPVPGAAITSRYNPRRLHPILKIVKPHNGTDFGAPIGTPIVASAFGKVSFVGAAGPNGNMITLSHEGGYETGYSHLSRFVKGLKVGDRVDQKQVIGYVGSTGRSTGPHLHFSAKRNDRFIDPESLNLDAFSRLEVSDRQVLAELRRRYDRLLDALPIPEPRPLEVARSGEEAPAEGADAPLAAESTGGNAPSAPAATLASIVAAPALSGPPALASAPQVAKSASLGRVTPSIYLSDRELIRQQPAVDDGEVDP